jgi:hypothetical protein
MPVSTGNNPNSVAFSLSGALLATANLPDDSAWVLLSWG